VRGRQPSAKLPFHSESDLNGRKEGRKALPGTEFGRESRDFKIQNNGSCLAAALFNFLGRRDYFSRLYLPRKNQVYPKKIANKTQILPSFLEIEKGAAAQHLFYGLTLPVFFTCS
jgi:hypothetical protein